MTRQPVPKIEVRDGTIRLGQFLKLANLAESGAHAKDLLDDNQVTVNGRPEVRRGRQLTVGDRVTVEGLGSAEVA